MQQQGQKHENLANDLEKRRDLQRLRIEQKKNVEQEKERYVQGLSQSIGSGMQNVPNNESQKKHELEQKRNEYIKKNAYNTPATEQEEKTDQKNTLLKKGRGTTSWAFLYAVAALDDLLDVVFSPLFFLPFISVFVSSITAIYLNVKLWNCGDIHTRKMRRRRRIAWVILDMIPIVNIFPASMYVVYQAQRAEAQRVKKEDQKEKVEKEMEEKSF